MKPRQDKERRRRERRIIIDRRASVRWEPANPDRRRNEGRRSNDFHPEWQ
ncbi:hypothetical protein Q9290_07460 [Oceanimonas sp. CHS3-5]|nr:hypothetical protein [Oceanimonas sp. CHS3-5]MDP5292124.1 hypothetical protein [Oceanimonas sp. CHS3-5]